MTELCKRSSVFETITSADYLSKKNNHAKLPKVNLTTQEPGREVNVIEAKLTRSQAKKASTAVPAASVRSTTPKKSSSAFSKVIALTEKKVTPRLQKRMKFNLLVTPQAAKGEVDENGNKPATANGDNGLSDVVNCTYEIKGQREVSDKTTFLELTKQRDTASHKKVNQYKNGNKNGPNIAFNVNLALSMDSKDMGNQSKVPSVPENPSDLSVDSTTHSTTATEQPSAITVAVRMRPLSESEKASQGSAITDILMKDDEVVIPHKKECFKFDCCLDSTNQEAFNFASQETVYRKMGEPLLDYAFKGYNTCLFAYGMSGSGKTYTMMGTKEVPGIIPRFINDLFKRVDSNRNVDSIVNISFMEIYNENINDLLADEFTRCTKNLRLRESPETGPFVEDLTVVTVEQYENAMELLREGVGRRSTASTDSNEQSSRSHTIFSIILVQNKKLDGLEQQNESGTESSCISKIHLIDLAGSERIQSTHDKERFREGTNINKSLLTLGKVITQLAEHNGKTTEHIPYRDSKLTFLLKDSLGGNSRTSMIATISPAKAQLEETISTLRYASTASKIVNIVHVNEDPKMKIINGLLKQISFLKKEVDRNKADSLNQSNGSNSSAEQEVIIQQKCGPACVEKVAEQIKELDGKFKEIRENQEKIQKSLTSLIEDIAKSEVPEFVVPEFCSSKVFDELQSLLKSVQSDDVLKDLPDYEDLMMQMHSKEDDLESGDAATAGDKGEAKKVEASKEKPVVENVWTHTGNNNKSKKLKKAEETQKKAEAEEAKQKAAEAAEARKVAAEAEQKLQEEKDKDNVESGEKDGTQQQVEPETNESVVEEESSSVDKGKTGKMSKKDRKEQERKAREAENERKKAEAEEAKKKEDEDSKPSNEDIEEEETAAADTNEKSDPAGDNFVTKGKNNKKDKKNKKQKDKTEAESKSNEQNAKKDSDDDDDGWESGKRGKKKKGGKGGKK